MIGKGKRGRPAKGGGRFDARLSAWARELLTEHTRGQSYEDEDGNIVTMPVAPAYATMTEMVERGIALAARKDLVPRLDDNPAYRLSRKKISRILADLDTNIRICLAGFFKRYGRVKTRWNAHAVRQKRLINSLIWFRGRLLLALAQETGQSAQDGLLKQLKALACEERFFKLRR